MKLLRKYAAVFISLTALAVNVAVSAEGNVSMKYENGVLKTEGAPSDAALYHASYENGRLNEVKRLEVKNEQEAESKNGDGFFLWSGMMPLCAPVRADTTAQKDTLVVYFSATGTTKTLAEKFAKAADADLVELEPAVPYTPADLNYNADCRANTEQNDDKARPEIANKIDNFDSYDTIMIGHPIWWGTVPRIIYTFMDSYDLSGKNVYMFCTSGSTGISTAVSDVKKYAPDAKVIDGMRGTGSTTEAQIKDWFKGNGYGE